MSRRLLDDAALRAEIEAVLADNAASKSAKNWYTALTGFLSEVGAAIPSRLHDEAFLHHLWDENPVAATGMGSVKVGAALADAGFRDWFAAEISKPLPMDAGEVEAHLIALYDGLQERLKLLCGRNPRLKINRVLCAIYPEHFTTIADQGKLLFLHKEMGGGANDHPVRAHKFIRRRVDEALGPVNVADPIDHIRRICLPWMVYEDISDDSTFLSPEGLSKDANALKPLPATLRRKGLTSLRGGFQTLLGYLPELSDGVSKEEFADIIKQSNPDLQPSSLITCINVVSREFDLCRRDGDTYRLSPRGINLLRTQDPDELADHLLTTVLGVDHVVNTLKKDVQAKAVLIAMLRKVHPGWTSDFGPTAILGWLTSLGVIAATDKKQVYLTERGKRWAEMVTWEPESLPGETDASNETTPASVGQAVVPEFAALWARLAERVAGKLVFEKSLVGQLHAGLWSHPVRHFAVLTGISGSGKTQLALNYALAACGGSDTDSDRIQVIPVQPGWYDASPLLGYVNPIHDSSYRSAPFLELLMRAKEDPEEPYVAILDEMNLSHPEQYLAPVLSAMETRGWLDLHQLGDDSTPIPRQIRYPSNLAIIGTVNMDETTHGLSDKVLDRAFTLEFWNINVRDFPGWEAARIPEALLAKTRDVLTHLSDALSPVRLHFGHRTIDDVIQYLTFHETFAPIGAADLDNIVYAKILPKLRGETSVKAQKALEDTYKILADHGLQRSREKVGALRDDLVATGSFRFWR